MPGGAACAAPPFFSNTVFPLQAKAFGDEQDPADHELKEAVQQNPELLQEKNGTESRAGWHQGRGSCVHFLDWAADLRRLHWKRVDTSEFTALLWLGSFRPSRV
jgi:hypothetical protein